MTTKEEILALAGECGIQNDYISEDQAVEAFYHAARKPLEEENQRLHMALADTEALEMGTGERCQKLSRQLAEKDAEIEFQKNAHGQAQQLLLEQGQQLAESQKDAAEFRASWDRAADTCSVLHRQLAAAQLQIKQYREALENCRLLAARHRNEEWAAHVLRFCGDAGVIGSPIRNTDTTALEAIAEKAGEVMRERCIAVSCDNPDGFVGGSIRALPGVTLADLKGAE